MKRVLFDLNIVLDVLLERRDHFVAEGLWAEVESRRLGGYLPAHGVTTIYYLLVRAKGPDFARRAVAALLEVFEVAEVNQAVLSRALDLSWSDYEDAVCATSAFAAGCDAIVTRNPDDFPNCPIPVFEPGLALAMIQAET